MTNSTRADEKGELEVARIQEALGRLTATLPGAIRYRFENTLENADRSFALLSCDREMASFRAITAEEEAATALIKCLQQRR